METTTQFSAQDVIDAGFAWGIDQAVRAAQRDPEGIGLHTIEEFLQEAADSPQAYAGLQARYAHGKTVLADAIYHQTGRHNNSFSGSVAAAQEFSPDVLARVVSPFVQGESGYIGSAQVYRTEFLVSRES